MTRRPASREDDPTQGGTNIFDFDIPAIQSGTPAGSPYRYRLNFSEYVTFPGGTGLVSIGPYNYYVRTSCNFDSSGNPLLATTFSSRGDNQIGSGTTPMTSDLH
ncbi:MAG: hypothetical protein JO356_14775 [Acidobacteria bacterium]|nr:hypothetical protein [Acidobacteriota bacterium]